MTCFRPAVVRLGLPFILLAIALTAQVGVAPAGAASGSASSGGADSAVPVTAAAPGWRAEMLARINAVRTAAGVRPLRPCSALRRSAQQYAMLMAVRDHFGHVGPDGSEPQERIRIEGYRWRVVGENIAAGQHSVAEVVAAWVGSPGHYANLIDPRYHHVGLGHASSNVGDHVDYWVQNLGRGRGC
jgi:uncharacterized protein YkwD